MRPIRLLARRLRGAAARQQLYADLHPLFLHHVLDVENAHNAIARAAILRTLLHHAAAPTATRHDDHALRYFLAFYSLPGPTVVQTGARLAHVLQTDALDQGDGMANYLFNITYSPLVHAFISSYPLPPSHPPLPLPTLVHDDTTLILPLSLALPPARPAAAYTASAISVATAAAAAAAAAASSPATPSCVLRPPLPHFHRRPRLPPPLPPPPPPRRSQDAPLPNAAPPPPLLH